MPARPAYGAADAEVFPVEAQMIASTPSASAFLNATVMPRSLEPPVGFCPSPLRQRIEPAERLAAARDLVRAEPRELVAAEAKRRLRLAIVLREGRRRRRSIQTDHDRPRGEVTESFSL